MIPAVLPSTPIEPSRSSGVPSADCGEHDFDRIIDDAKADLETRSSRESRTRPADDEAADDSDPVAAETSPAPPAETATTNSAPDDPGLSVSSSPSTASNETTTLDGPVVDATPVPGSDHTAAVSAPRHPTGTTEHEATIAVEGNEKRVVSPAETTTAHRPGSVDEAGRPAGDEPGDEPLPGALVVAEDPPLEVQPDASAGDPGADAAADEAGVRFGDDATEATDATVDTETVPPTRDALRRTPPHQPGAVASGTDPGPDVVPQVAEMLNELRGGTDEADRPSLDTIRTSGPSHTSQTQAGPASPPLTGAANATTASGTSPTTPPAVPDQIVSHVSSLVDAEDGIHELTIDLDPVELGRVRLAVRLEDGVVSVRLLADETTTRRLLGSALGELRTALENAGVRTGDLDVDQRHPGHDGDDAARGGRDQLHDPAPSAARRGPSDRVRMPLTSTDTLDVLL